MLINSTTHNMKTTYDSYKGYMTFLQQKEVYIIRGINISDR